MVEDKSEQKFSKKTEKSINKKTDKDISKKIILGIVFLLLLIGLMSSFVIIDGGHRGVIVSKTEGVKDRVLPEGFSFKTPIIDKVYELEVRTKKYEETTDSTTDDQQSVESTVVVNYNIDPEKVNKLYQDIGLNYNERVLRPSLQGAVKSVMAQYEAEQLIKNRSEVSKNIEQEMRDRLDTRYLSVTDFNLVNIEYSDEYAKAIEEKVTEQQKKQREKIKLDRIEIQQQQKVKKAIAEAEAKLISSKADSKAIKIRQQALSNSPEFLKYMWIDKWNGIVPTVVSGDAESNILLDMDLNSSMGKGKNSSLNFESDISELDFDNNTEMTEEVEINQENLNTTQ